MAILRTFGNIAGMSLYDVNPGYVEATKVVDHLVAIELIEEFMDNAPKKYREAKDFKKIEPVARRIRAKFLESKAIPMQRKKRELLVPIVAASIQQAMAQYKIQIDVKAICEFFQIPYDEDAVYAEGKAKTFAKRTDWTKAKGVARDDRRKAKKEKVRADRKAEPLTAGLEAALGGW
jgi:hypothetical protein